MKSFNMKKNSLFLLLLILTGAQLNAQEFRTGESISKQLKNNAVQGLKYGQEVKPAASSSKGFSGSSLAKEIKEGRYAQVRAGAASAAPAARSGNAQATATVDLASSRSAAEVERELKASRASKTEAPVQAPAQEEKTNTPSKGKAAPVKKVQQ